MSKLMSKWKWIVLGFFVCAFAMAFLIFMFVDQLPERGLAEDFLRTNQKIREYFGDIEDVSYNKQDAANVSFGRGKREGMHSFSIKSSKKSGNVRVHWHSEGSGINFTVDSVELIERGKKPTVIWPSSVEE